MPVDVGCNRLSFVPPWPLRSRVRGGTETERMRLAGWRSLAIMQRCGSSPADERARLAQQRLSLGDRL